MSLHIEFMNTSRSSFAKSGKAVPPPKGDPWLFWWTILIFLLLGLTTFTWFGCLYVFRHPEKPKNYHLLAKFNKIEPLRKFDDRTVPKGKFHTAKDIYSKYFAYSDSELSSQNELFKRAYIQNYADQQPVYIKGDYRIYKVTELAPKDVFPSGLVVRAKSMDLPNVSIEFVFPADKLPKIRPSYGDDIKLLTNDYFATVLNISRLPEDSLCFTVVPLSYYPFKLSEQDILTLSPPFRLNMDGGWPLTDDTPGDDPDKVAAGSLPVSAAGN